MDMFTTLAPFFESQGARFLILVIILIFGPYAILSEKTAEKFALLGWGARRFRELKENAKATQIKASQREVEELRAEIRRVDKARKEDRERLEDALNAVQKNERRQHSYIVYITGRLRDFEVLAADRGFDLPRNFFLTYTEWSEERRDEEKGKKD